MHIWVVTIIYLMFFMSGAAALMYQVVWVRSLSLVFGGSHLAVTSVLAIFMTGLALGSFFFGKFADRVKKPMQLYGYLEIGIAASAILFIWLTKVYPAFYIHLAQGKDDNYFYLTLIRVLFSIAALILPTTMMGGTLPILSRFLASLSGEVRKHLSLLYGINTLGAVMGASVAGFFFMRFFSVSFTLKSAIFLNLFIGFASIILERNSQGLLPGQEDREKEQESGVQIQGGPSSVNDAEAFACRLVLVGIGISGFCALGYEVLWTRILTIVVGASVYSFTTMLVAFLTGIALGSKAFGMLGGKARKGSHDISASIRSFGLVQIVIGATALLVTVFLGDLALVSTRLLGYFLDKGGDVFTMKLTVNFLLAFAYMVVPAFFMGVAFPLAGTVHAAYRRKVGAAVGEVMAYNTVGAILGAALSGFAMIYVFGIEKSLLILVLVNTGYGGLVLLSVFPALDLRKKLGLSAGAAVAAALMFLAVNQEGMRLWNTDYFAIYRNNDLKAFSSPEKMREELQKTEVLYYAEGQEAIISSIRALNGEQALLVNGKVVASNRLGGQQCQLTLGHLPMLLHPDPRRVLVVGLGTGMTLGATSVHPGVQDLTLAEIEPEVLDAARTFSSYNHDVLDNPKLKVVFNDGRNFLLTTGKRFDVITADPIHPWTRGASYLYTDEYFRLASNRLSPGGIMCQWLPVYELSTKDLKSVVRTFNNNFKYTMLWMTFTDAELIGSNSPIVIDEEMLENRIRTAGAVAADLRRVFMGSAKDLLSYFVMGGEQLENYGRNGTLNTDDNLYLEFSSPLAITRQVMGENLTIIADYCQSIAPYLVPEKGDSLDEKRLDEWKRIQEAARLTMRAQALFLDLQHSRELFTDPQFQALTDTIDDKYASFAPARFLRNEYLAKLVKIPKLIERTAFTFTDADGRLRQENISAVVAPLSRERAYVFFVNNRTRTKYGKLLVPYGNKDDKVRHFVNEVMADLRTVYKNRAAMALTSGRKFPEAKPTMRLMRSLIENRIEAAATDRFLGRNV